MKTKRVSRNRKLFLSRRGFVYAHRNIASINYIKELRLQLLDGNKKTTTLADAFKIRTIKIRMGFIDERRFIENHKQILGTDFTPLHESIVTNMSMGKWIDAYNQLDIISITQNAEYVPDTFTPSKFGVNLSEHSHLQRQKRIACGYNDQLLYRSYVNNNMDILLHHENFVKCFTKMCWS